MLPAIVVDALLVLLLISYVLYGWRNGFFRSLGGGAGLVAGAIGAFMAIPLIGSWVPAPEWRTPAILAVALLLILGGQGLGAAVGNAIRRRMKNRALRATDRALGAGLNLVVAALVTSMLAFSVAQLGVPVISQATASSTVIRTIDRLTPTLAQTLLAQLRGLAVDQGMPRIIEAFGGTPQIPDVTTGTPALVNAAQSVVKITGNAYACGRNQSGSGFVVGTNRVMTNAHVVAGVGEPIVQVPGGAALPGRVVYFDPVDDLAVVAVDGLTAAPLPLVPNLPAGSPAVVHGYPLGGPFNSQPASVISVHAVNVPDIYGDNPTPRQVYSLATKVQQGNSGGPLLSEAGDVAGVIFAKGSDTQDVGYALAMEEVTPVAEQASSLSQPVSSGGCLAG